MPSPAAVKEADYEWRQLVDFLDAEVADISCLIFDEVQKIYMPHGRDWIKSRMF